MTGRSFFSESHLDNPLLLPAKLLGLESQWVSRWRGACSAHPLKVEFVRQEILCEPTPHQEDSAMTSDHSELQAIKNRLSTLEAQNRRLKWSGLSLLAFLSAFALMGQAAPTPQVIEAQRFVLKDAKGNVRAWLGPVRQRVGTNSWRHNKEPKMTLKVSEDASDLHFYGGEHSGMNLGVDLGYPAISMAGTGGTVE